MDLRELLAEAVSGVPQAIPGRCVHERVEVGSCQRCVDACPLDAWVLDDAELALDTGRCDGCGLCVAHCPEGALSQPGSSSNGKVITGTGTPTVRKPKAASTVRDSPTSPMRAAMSAMFSVPVTM